MAGFSGMLSFEVKGGKQEASRLCEVQIVSSQFSAMVSTASIHIVTP